MTTEEQALVCRWLGIPHSHWTLGEALVIFSDSQKSWYLQDFPASSERFQKQYPNLLDWAGFGLMVEALEKLGLEWEHVRAPSGGGYNVGISKENGPYLEGDSDFSPTLPEALAQAVLAVAKKEKS